jgi:hypothetical protein
LRAVSSAAFLWALLSILSRVGSGQVVAAPQPPAQVEFKQRLNTIQVWKEGQEQDSASEEKQLRTLNAERQKALVANTSKLLKLATELNAEIAKSKNGSLTPEQLHKLAEIERLAHSVREKMATSVRGVSAFHTETVPILR